MRTIVAAFDENESASRALERAAELAGALDARLVVLSIAPPFEKPRPVETLQPSFGATPIGAARLSDDPLALTPGPGAPAETIERSREHAERARDIAARAGVDVEVVQDESDDPAAALVALAAERDADLLVVGAHQPTIWQRLFGEDVDRKLTRRAGCDVLVVR